MTQRWGKGRRGGSHRVRGRSSLSLALLAGSGRLECVLRDISVKSSQEALLGRRFLLWLELLLRLLSLLLRTLDWRCLWSKNRVMDGLLLSPQLIA